MHWEMDDNVDAIKHALRIARDDGAAICVFSELAVTGFHRRIADWARPERSGPAVDDLRAEAARLGIAAVLGAPTYADDGRRFNSHLFVDRQGALLGSISKSGLTAQEATFFAAGTARPALQLADVRCSAVICREIEDSVVVVPPLQGRGVDLIFWPRQMRPDPDKPVQDPPEHVVQAQALARELSAHVVQTNCPNALNRPEESAHTGHSARIAPDGELLFRLPMQGYGVGVFTLGDRHYRWHPVPG